MLNQQKIEDVVAYKFKLVVGTMTHHLIWLCHPFYYLYIIPPVSFLYHKLHDIMQVWYDKQILREILGI